jgi:uncharacterized circularly permuted ATP-grasp superfamily protein
MEAWMRHDDVTDRDALLDQINALRTAATELNVARTDSGHFSVYVDNDSSPVRTHYYVENRDAKDELIADLRELYEAARS